jgi:hypothetical protein
VIRLLDLLIQLSLDFRCFFVINYQIRKGSFLLCIDSYEITMSGLGILCHSFADIS